MADRATWRSPTLGEASEVQLRDGQVRYHEAGSGSTLVFVHGLLVNANLWRKVVARLSSDFRCVTLDLPLGSHVLPMPDGDLSPPGLADVVADTLDALDLEDVTLVGNDTGGAISQLVATRRPERIGRLVLTSCDAFDNFPPKVFRFLLPLARMPAVIPIAFAGLRLRPLRRLPIALGWVTKRSVERESEDSYVLPTLTRPELRVDLARALAGIDPRYTLEAAERLGTFGRPTLIAWSREDKLFPTEHAERLTAAIPDSRLEWIDDSYTFSPEDQPARLAALIEEFVAANRTAP